MRDRRTCMESNPGQPNERDPELGLPGLDLRLRQHEGRVVEGRLRALGKR